jgi:hypothetical protein
LKRYILTGCVLNAEMMGVTGPQKEHGVMGCYTWEYSAKIIVIVPPGCTGFEEQS